MKIDTSDVSFKQEVITSPDFKAILCNDWDTAKSVLTSIQGSFKNPIVIFIFTLVINAGQAVHDKVCG